MNDLVSDKIKTGISVSYSILLNLKSYVNFCKATRLLIAS